MKVKIAAFGHEESIAKINHLIKDRSDVEIVPFIYENEIETVELIEKAFMCDVYLFSESISYHFVKDKIKRKRLPVSLIPHDEHMVLYNFYQIRDVDKKIDRLSIDFDQKDVVDKILAELNMENKDIYVYDYGLESEPSIDEIVDHHLQLWEQGKIDHVLTSVQSVKHKLKDKNIPVKFMTSPNTNIEEAVKQAKSIIKLELITGAQVVVGHFKIKDHEKVMKQKGKEEFELLSNKFFSILDKFSKKTDVSLYPLNSYEFVAFGTKPLITHLKNHYRDFPLLTEIINDLQVPVSIGYGLGLTAKQASINAKIALEKAEQTADNRCYIVNERQETIGPIGVKKEFDTSKLYHALIHKARLNNELSYNFIEFIKSRNNEPFSSNDIAKFYNVTKRSAERTVNKLLNGEVIRVSGEERPYQKGRPRKLFTLNQ